MVGAALSIVLGDTVGVHVSDTVVKVVGIAAV